MRKNSFLLIVFILFFASFIFGCPQKKISPPTDSIQQLDETRTVSINMGLKTDPALASEKINVVVKNDEATLSGAVHSEGLSKRAEEIALKTPGIKKVINKLEVIKE